MAIKTETEIRSKTGRFVLGHLIEMDDGTKLYMARRRHRELFRSKRKTISQAMSDDVCGWAIDEHTLFSVRAKGVLYIGVRVIDTGDVYVAPMKLWFDRKVYKDHNYEGVGRGGSRQRLLYLQHFHLKKGTVQITTS